MTDTSIRTETPRDYVSVRTVNEAAFETSAEADLVDRLREQASPLISLVAEEGGSIIGHVLFSPVTISDHPTLKLMGLAPMAVMPEHQRQGVGSALVRAGLEECRRLDVGAVVVLGHPGFYPRFGFVAAAQSGITCEYDVPAEAFMVMELEPGYLSGVSGIVKYHSAFAGL